MIRLVIRDRALLEFMYASAARVTETVGLDLTDLDLNDRVARLLRKGDKQRLVPLGSYACEALSEYLATGREQLALKSETGIEQRAVFSINEVKVIPSKRVGNR